MSGHAKPINLFGAPRKSSDYGAVFPAINDAGLRTRVVKAIRAARSVNGENELPALDHDELREVVVYISELEDALLRHHWGQVQGNELLARLKSATGLDITQQIDDLDALTDGASTL